MIKILLELPSHPGLLLDALGFDDDKIVVLASEFIDFLDLLLNIQTLLHNLQHFLQVLPKRPPELKILIVGDHDFTVTMEN